MPPRADGDQSPCPLGFRISSRMRSARLSYAESVGLGMLGGVPGGYMGGGESIGRARDGSAPW